MRALWRRRAADRGALGRRIAARPRMLALRPKPTLNWSEGMDNHLEGEVETIAFLGSIVRIQVRAKHAFIALDEFNNPNLDLPAIGDSVAFGFPREACLILDGSG